MLGLGALESLLCVNQGKVLIPVENFHPRDVHMDARTVLGQAEVVQAEVPVGDLDKQVDEFVVVVVGADVGSRKQNRVETVKWPSCLTADELPRLKQVVGQFDIVFALAGEDLGCTALVQHKIDTADHPPIKQYPRRTPFAQRAKIAAMISDMEAKGVGSPSISPWVSPIVLVPKKDGTIRFCVDFRRLNVITKMFIHSL